MALAANQLYQGDCIQRMEELAEGSVDLVFADPPFNIGYDYDVYDDRKPYDHYLDWSREWIKAVARVLKPTGTFWLAIGDEYAAELKLIAQNDALFTCRSWVIWYYTFGVNCTRKFNRSHAHLFHFVKDRKNFTFNYKERAIRVPSARQLVYADIRANPDGRLPDDTWIIPPQWTSDWVLRPQDVPDGFNEDQDTWYFSRVAGTFKERAGFHGCQMPEQLLGRIIRASSNEGDLVLDPFGGSGTTLAVAKKLGRSWIGFELSRDYVKKINARLAPIAVGQPLDGPENPLTSAPATPTAASGNPAHSRASQSKKALAQTVAAPERRRGQVDSKDAVVAAYLLARDGHSSDRIIADPSLNAAFIDECRNTGVSGTPKDLNRMLLRLRKAGKLPRLEKRPERLPSLTEMDKFSFASEIALGILTKDNDLTLDDVLCDPELAAEFDRLAQEYAPGFRPFDYRWAAFQIRKRGHDWKRSAQAWSGEAAALWLPRAKSWRRIRFDRVHEVPGIYLISDEGRRPVYLGETVDLRTRLRWQNDRLCEEPWSQLGISTVSILPLPLQGDGTEKGRRGRWLRLLSEFRPRLNYQKLAFELQSA